MSILKLPSRIGGLIGSIPSTVSGVYGLTKLSEVNFPFAIGGDTYTYIQDGKYWRCHMFSQVGSDTLTFLRGGLVEYLVVGGGGGGNSDAGGGGGGGGFRNGVAAVATGGCGITVGGGGSQGVAGGASVFGQITSDGGGKGGTCGAPAGGNGGSGGGAAGTDFGFCTPNTAFSGGTATGGQGYSGGSRAAVYSVASAGGGGAGSAGSPGSGNNGGAGGTGATSSLSGSSFAFSGGGGGGALKSSGNSGGGATDGGGAGGNSSSPGASGSAFSGGGGGGGAAGGYAGGSGGSGIVIVRYQITQAEFEGDEPYYDNVSLLLHMNGANGSTTFSDSSKHRHTVTANGNAQISTAQSKFGGASAAFDGTGDYLSVPDDAALDFGTGDFTIEMWAYIQSTGDYALYSHPASGGPMLVSAAGTFRFRRFAVADVVVASALPTTNQWIHIAACRSGTSTRLFFNGSQTGSTAADTANYTVSANPLIGVDIVSGLPSDIYLQGYIDDLRITKGVARYTGNFTPPQREFRP